jgi:hypothetical protein
MNLYHLGARYYSPEWRRFISPASTTALSSSTPNGLNLYSYANNASSIYESRIKSFGDSFRTNSKNAIRKAGISGSGIARFASKRRSNSRIDNLVAMTHHTESLIKDPVLAWVLGNISYTVTEQLNPAKTFYVFGDVGNDGCNVGVGMNLGNWYGVNAYVSSDIGVGFGWQLTPWITGSSGWSLEDGVSISAGIIIEDTTHEITVSVGNGALIGYALCASMAVTPIPGARATAAFLAGAIFIVDFFI